MGGIIFLFGAGASHGAGDIVPERPPLGCQLYGELSRIYPGSWGTRVSPVRDAFEKNFEYGMEIVYDKYSHIVAGLMRQLATYFIQFRPCTGRSLYCKLIAALREHNLLEEVAFSTINYDCILEFALIRQGIEFNYWKECSSSVLPVWKLHGSCNMFSKDIQASPGVSFSKGVTWGGGVEAFLDISTVVEKCVGSGLYPSMCLYMKGKPLQVSPSVVKRVQEMWQRAVEAARAVFCIGVNPWPEDGHIWNALGRTSASLYFVGDKEVFGRWLSSYRRNGHSEYISSYFSSGFEGLERRLIQYATERRR